MQKQIKLIVDWMRVGFIHGVMNTDNSTISGETIDYGPCAFMDSYDAKTVFSSIDTQGRYSFANQPSIIHWNLVRLAECLLPLIDKNEKKSIEIAQNTLNNFSSLFKDEWLQMMRKKIGIEDQKRLGSWFGKLEVHPTARHNPEVVRIEEDDKRRANNNLWHSDMSFKVEPPLGSILKAEEIPDVGGDTLFADMEQAYQGLSNEIKERIDCAHALHCWPSAWIDLAMRSAGISDRDEFLRQCPDPEHPVVRSHPKTGNKSLYVNTAFTRRIIGMSKTESDELLTKLYQHCLLYTSPSPRDQRGSRMPA